ncbi:MAG TPA: GFA family protein [Devosia sp.]|nr:GFA family protein [Devosia sp.]
MTDRRMPEGPFSGGCQCGAIRFHATRLRGNPHVCYCRMCQKATGNLFAALVGVRHEHLTWTRGRPAEFMSSDVAARGFCPNCGTSLYYRAASGPHVSLSIGAFDEPHRIALWYQMGLEGKHPSLMRLESVEEVGTTEANEKPEDIDRIRNSNHQHPDHDTETWMPHRAVLP